MKKREKIYIIPTEYGLMYGFGIFASLIGGAVYTNNLAFMLCFFLVALFLIGMVQTHNNLKKISIEKVSLFLSPSQGRGRGVIWLKSENSEGHNQIRLQSKEIEDEIDASIDVIYPHSLHPHYFEFKTHDWGQKTLKKVRLSTRYPFGFFYVWRSYKVSVPYSIFPKPMGEQSLNTVLDKSFEGQVGLQNKQGDDFSGHKRYERGASMKHVDWKAYARGNPLLIKSFDEGDRHTYFIDFAAAKGNLEERYHQVSQWIHQCEQGGHLYSLKIGDDQVSQNQGEKHKAHCLKVLAKQREGL